MSYDPDSYDGTGRMPTLYARTGDGATTQWCCWVAGSYVFVEWGQVGGVLQSSSFACAPKNVGRANASTSQEQAIKEAIAKWKKQVKKKYHLTAEATEQLNFKPMLAKSFEDRSGKLEYPVDVQPKFDGVRCLAYREHGKVMLQSRGGDPYDVAHIQEALAPFVGDDLVLDGELYVHGMKLQDIVSLVKKPKPSSLQLTYCIYDITSRSDQSDPWHVRLCKLHSWFSQARQGGMLMNVMSVQTATCTNEQQAWYYHDEYVRLGFEGLIIRLPEGLYRFGYRSSELLKLKAFKDQEFRIIGYRAGKGKFENCPIFECVTGGEKTFDVVPKGTDAERASMLANANSLIGRLLNVRFFAWTNDGVPQFPVGMYIREEGT